MRVSSTVLLLMLATVETNFIQEETEGGCGKKGEKYWCRSQLLVNANMELLSSVLDGWFVTFLSQATS